MGQDFTAILDHRLETEGLTRLPSQLDKLMSSVGQQFGKARLGGIKESPDRWMWDWNQDFDPPFSDWIEAGNVGLSGPGSLSVEFGSKSLSLYCWVRWREFVTDKMIQQAMRIVTLCFAECFASKLAIYVPDSSSKFGEGSRNLVHDGASIAEILDHLADLGPPSTSIESMCRRTKAFIDGGSYQTLECDGYYIDRFEDLRGL